MQTQGKSRLIRLGVEILLVLITSYILIWSHLRRPDALLLSGKEAYYYLQEGAVSTILLFLKDNIALNIIQLTKILPVTLGILSAILFYSILRRLRLNYGIVIISTLILIISPSFIYLFGTLNSFSFTSFLFLLSMQLFLRKKEFLGVATLYLIPFFGLTSTLLGLLLVLIYSLKKQRFRLFLGSLPSIAILYFYQIKTIPNYSLGVISDFGGQYGIGFFIILLSLFGLQVLWKKKYKHLTLYTVILSLWAFSAWDIKIFAYLNFILVGLAALGLIGMMKSTWKSELIKQLSIIIMICGLIFSGLSYINFVSSDLPNKEVIEMINYMKTIPEGKVFSQDSREYWIKYSGNEFITDETMFYTRDIEQALEIINTKKIKYLWIDKEMKEKIWTEEDQDLQYLLKYSKNFKINKMNNYITLWEFENVVSN